MVKRTQGEKVFAVFNALILLAVGLACVIPIWHCICCSISDPLKLSAHRGLVFHPLGTPTLKGYEQCFKNICHRPQSLPLTDNSSGDSAPEQRQQRDRGSQ